MAETKTILSLCDYSGAWCEPFRRAGYDVRQYDLKNGDDIVLIKKPAGSVYGILAAPPCTHLANSGARHFKAKGDKALKEGLALVDACLRIVYATQPAFWCMENPIGRLIHYIGKWQHIFNPCDFAGYLSGAEAEAEQYTKKTCLWGNFTMPEKKPLPPVLGSKMWRLYGGKSERTKAMRSMTPKGFAEAFFLANGNN
tara:strand:+ start:40 stop:633 length:594 start_codon:yes stop_codon:yes gene_type:complete